MALRLAERAPDPAGDAPPTAHLVAVAESAGVQHQDFARASNLPLLLDSLSEEDRHFIFRLDRSDSARGLAEVLQSEGKPGSSENAVSHRSIVVSKKLLANLTSRSLEDVNIAAIMLDGTGVGGKKSSQTEIWALGITMDGQKIPLGVVEGPEETKELTAELLRNLVEERKLDVSDCLWIIDGGKALRAGIREVAGRNAVIQRCIAHKFRNIAWKGLGIEARRGLEGEKVRIDLWKAYSERDFRTAAVKLSKLRRWLKVNNHKAAAAAVKEGWLMTLTLRLLRPGDQALWRALTSTNAQESAHAWLEKWAGRVKNWGPAWDPQNPDKTDHRLRVFAAAIACAERKWGPIGSSRRKRREGLSRTSLEDMTLAIAVRRQKKVELSVDRVDATTVTISRLHVADRRERRAYKVVEELARWADRNGKILTIGPNALERNREGHLIDRRLRRSGFAASAGRDHAGATRGSLVRTPRPWAERTAGATVTELSKPEVAGAEADLSADAGEALPATGTDDGQAPAAEARQDALGWVRNAVGEEMLVAVGQRALALGPETVRMSDSDLEALLATREAARTGLASVEADVTTWARENWKDAAWEVALERMGVRPDGRPLGPPLNVARRAVLGEAKTQWIEDKAAFLAGWISDAPAERLAGRAERVRGVLGALDAHVARVDHAARVYAAARETERRQLIRAMEERVRTAGPPALDAPQNGRRRDGTLGLHERNARSLGRRENLVTHYVEAQLESQIRELDDATLHALRDELQRPWDRLDTSSGLTTARLERQRDAVRADRRRLLYEAGHRSRKVGRGARTAAWEEGANAGREEADKLLEKLRAIEEELAAGRAKVRGADHNKQRGVARQEEVGVDRFLLEHAPAAALDAAVEVELRERQLQRAQDPAEIQMQVAAPSRDLAGAGMGM